MRQLIQELEACCAAFRSPPIDQGEAETLAAALRALADPARLRLVSLIAAQPGAEACVCDLTDDLDLSQPTVSHHLRVLLDAGIVAREQRGRWAYYRLRQEPLRALSDALDLPSAVTRSSPDLTSAAAPS